ncbi:hypothetical protein ACLMJK_003987 [Lecanora helva]
MEILSAAISHPFPDCNPLSDVKIPDSILGPDIDCLDTSPPLISETASTPVVEKPKAFIGADAKHLQPPALLRKTSSFAKPQSRNPLRDIQLPNAIVAPEFQAVKAPSVSPTVRSARNFNSLACPPQLLPQEWNGFMTDLEAAAASSSNGHKSYAIAIGLTTSVGDDLDDASHTWGTWHDLALNEGKGEAVIKAKFEPEWKRENVGSVVERWNEKWTDRGVRIALEVNYKGDK